MNQSRLEWLLSELRNMSPMPEDSALTEEHLKRYDAIMNELYNHLDPSIVQPVLESLGYGLGFGVYWNVVTLLERFEWDYLKPALITALESDNPGTRMWAALILGRQGEEMREAIPPLLSLLDDSHPLVRSHAVTALNAIAGRSVRQYIEPLKNDPAHEVRSTVKHVIAKD